MVRYLAGEAHADLMLRRTKDGDGVTSLSISARLGHVGIAHYLSRKEYGGVKLGRTLEGSAALKIATRHNEVKIARDLRALGMTRNKRFLRLMKLVGKLVSDEYKRASVLKDNDHTGWVDRFEKALRHQDVPCTQQFEVAVLRLIGGSSSSMSGIAKSRLTLAFKTHFMLLRAARRQV
uniref:Uncharacterized protein n=1 Tax=Octactis speculum TaxID=3111310 RepID=A0A7S2FQH4_9STRA|mmetsp:Transcript_27825/g.38134  ORF Transcript_27825/g.38134 Transcript_27825/m.38134 type:complete len:178 (+) Transcript_27825:2-535(+)